MMDVSGVHASIQLQMKHVMDMEFRIQIIVYLRMNMHVFVKNILTAQQNVDIVYHSGTQVNVMCIVMMLQLVMGMEHVHHRQENVNVKTNILEPIVINFAQINAVDMEHATFY